MGGIWSSVERTRMLGAMLFEGKSAMLWAAYPLFGQFAADFDFEPCSMMAAKESNLVHHVSPSLGTLGAQ